MYRYTRSSFITPAIILLFSLIYLISALKINNPVVDGVVTESFFPMMISVVMMLATSRLLLLSLYGDEDDSKSIVFTRKTFIIIGVTFLFPFVFHLIGFTFAVPLYVFSLTLIFDDKIQHIKKKLVVSLLISIAVFILYQIIFQIRFPEIWS